MFSNQVNKNLVIIIPFL